MQICVPFEMNQSVNLLNYGLGNFLKITEKVLKSQGTFTTQKCANPKICFRICIFANIFKTAGHVPGYKIKDKCKLVYLMSTITAEIIGKDSKLSPFSMYM